jgi:argininosuccinate synthase
MTDDDTMLLPDNVMIAGQLIRSFSDLADRLNPSRPLITLFSGGLDSSYLLLRLRQAGFDNVHALSVDVGGTDTTHLIEHITCQLGARLHTQPQHELFASEFVTPAIKAHAVYLDTHPVSSTLSRPLLAQTAVQLAGELASPCILHSAHRSQNTLRRLNGALSLLGYCGLYGSPFDLQPVSREEKLAALARAGITFREKRTISGDSNLWCREFESGALDDPEDHAIPESIYLWSSMGADVSTRQDAISLTFEDGVPVAVDGQRMNLVSLIGHLNPRVGAFGLGRYTGLEHLDNGKKVFEVREMPAAWLILRTARHLEGACLPADLLREKLAIEQLWAREAVEGRWFGPTKAAAEAFIDQCAGHVSGTVRWALRAGGATTTAIIGEAPLYIRDREQWEFSAIDGELEPFDVLFGRTQVVA